MLFFFPEKIKKNDAKTRKSNLGHYFYLLGRNKVYQIRYEHFSENYPKFRAYKIRDAETMQMAVLHKDLRSTIAYAREYPKYKNIFLLDESRFAFSRFDIFQDYDRKFTLTDLQDIIREKCDTHKLGVDGIKRSSFVDTIYVNGEPKKYVIGEQGQIFFRLYMMYLHKTTLNVFNSFYGDVMDQQGMTILPQSFHSMLFLRDTLQKENFLLMYIADSYCKVIKQEAGFYQQIETLNLGTNALRQMYKDNDILDLWNKPQEHIDTNPLAYNVVKQSVDFYVELLCKRLHEKKLSGSDIILVSPIIKNGYFLECFNQEYAKYSQNYIVPFHYSDQIETYGKTREPEDIDALVMMNRLKID